MELPDGASARDIQAAAIEKQIRKYRGLAWTAIALGTVLGLWGAYRLRRELPDVAQFLSGTTALLWSLAGILLIYVAFLGQRLQILFQQQELEDNRKELADTREEVKRQREEAEEQNRTLRQQRFEASFFELLRLHADIVSALFVQSNVNAFMGRRAFEELRRQFKAAYTTTAAQELKYEIERVQRAWNLFFNQNHSVIGHYFRNFYHIVKFVDESTVEHKQLYVNIARAQLSSDELYLLFYNGLSPIGSRRFKKLMERYALLEHLPHEILESPNHIDMYEAFAYDESPAREE